MVPDEARRRAIRLRAARGLKGFSQQEAATRIGVSRTTLSGWENGEPIDEAWMTEITRVLGGSKGWVRYGEGKPPEGYDETGLPEVLESALPATQEGATGLPVVEAGDDEERPVRKPTRSKRTKGEE